MKRNALEPLEPISWEETVDLDDCYFCSQFDFELCSVCIDQMSGRAFFSCEICTQGVTSGNLAVMSVVKHSW